MKALPAIPVAAIAGWGVCCAFYAVVAWVAFPQAHIFDVIYWDCFYAAWHAVAFSAVVLGILAFSIKLRTFVFRRFGFIGVGLVGGLLTWPLGVAGWSVVMYGSIYSPWLIPSLGGDVPEACFLGLACITLYGLFVRLYRVRAS